MSPSQKVTAFVNNINPVNWKIVLVGYLQTGFFLMYAAGWIRDVFGQVALHIPHVDFHDTTFGIVAGLLAGLSGIGAIGRGVDRVTDYGYVERKNAGKAIDATSPQRQSVAINTSDNAQINVTPNTATTVPAPRPSAQVRPFDPGA